MSLKNIISFFLGLALGIATGWLLCLHRDHRIADEYMRQEQIQMNELRHLSKQALEMETMGRDIDWFIHLMEEQENLVINWNKEAIEKPIEGE